MIIGILITGGFWYKNLKNRISLLCCQRSDNACAPLEIVYTTSVTSLLNDLNMVTTSVTSLLNDLKWSILGITTSVRSQVEHIV